MFQWEYLPEICLNLFSSAPCLVKTQIWLHLFLYWGARWGAEPKVTIRVQSFHCPPAAWLKSVSLSSASSLHCSSPLLPGAARLPTQTSQSSTVPRMPKRGTRAERKQHPCSLSPVGDAHSQLWVSFLPQDGEGKEGWAAGAWRQVFGRAGQAKHSEWLSARKSFNPQPELHELMWPQRHPEHPSVLQRGHVPIEQPRN